MNHAAPRQKTFGYILGQHYTVFDGLAGMHVEDIYQDQRGTLWIATADGGVSRFDGTHFDTFGLSQGMPHLTVMSIAEEADGRLLFGTLGGGLAAYDGRDFQVYTTEHGLPSNEILSLQPQTDGSILVLTGAGMGWFVEGQCVKTVTEIAGQPLGAVYDMATDAAGTTWLAARERGVISLVDGHPMNADFSGGDSAMQWPWKFAQDASGFLWIAFRYVDTEPVVGRYDPASQQLEFIRAGRSPLEEAVVQHGTRHVRSDDRDRLWLSRRGVLVYDGQTWHPLSVHEYDSHLSDTRLTYEDREGNIWMGLWGGGLVFCDPVSVQLYTEADGLPDEEIECLSEDRDGRLWIGTQGGLACREKDRIRPVDPTRTVSALVVDRQGQVWSVGLGGQLCKETGGAVQALEGAEATQTEGIAGLWEDQAGHLNACTSTGRWGRIEQDRFTELKERLPPNCTVVLPASSGAIWFGGSGKESALGYYKDGHCHTPDIAGVEAITDVRALCEYQGALWIGTENYGLFSLDYAAGAIRQFTVDQGALSVNGISTLANDPQGGMWIGTSGGGVLKYDGQTFHRIRLGPGALENIVDAILRDRQGQLWFGTRGGLIAYQPGETPPFIQMRRVVAGRTWDAPQSVSYPDTISEIQFHFQGISFRSGAPQLRYSHRLVGHAPAAAWSAFTPANKTTYNGLPVGSFRFEVRAMDRDGLVSQAARVEVQVVPDPHNARIQLLEQMAQIAGREFITQSPVMDQLLEQVKRMAPTDMTMLVLGETGVGKGVLAQIIHKLSSRRGHPFISVNCGALPAGLVESELFGHEKGAFTSAASRHIGYFERADGGTLFLDEIGELSMETQQVLLQVLEEDRITHVGGEKSIPVDVRVIAATNKDLAKAIQAKTFRDDLFYRLSVLSVVIPPLRERPEDIPLLATHFARQCAKQLGQPMPVLSEEVVAHLRGYGWPGNVRELEHWIERAVVLGKGGIIPVEDVPLAAAAAEPAAPAADTLPIEHRAGAAAEDEDEKQQILAALQAANWRIYGPRGAARLLSIGPEKLRYRMRKHGLQRPKERSH